MQGAGNDFVVLDETTQRLNLSPAHYRLLADRHFGVGADQILTVRPAPQTDVDFEYVIHNADGGEVEQCGNGSRCFVRFVREQGLTDKTTVRVKVHGGIITLQEMPDGQVTVDMGAPVFDLPQVPFDATHATAVNATQWQLALSQGDVVQVGVVSMGNPHAVQVVPDVDTAPVHTLGPLVEGGAVHLPPLDALGPLGQGRAGRDRKRQPLGLPRAMVRILAQDQYPHLVQRGQAQGLEWVGREHGGARRQALSQKSIQAHPGLRGEKTAPQALPSRIWQVLRRPLPQGIGRLVVDAAGVIGVQLQVAEREACRKVVRRPREQRLDGRAPGDDERAVRGFDTSAAVVAVAMVAVAGHVICIESVFQQAQAPLPC